MVYDNGGPNGASGNEMSAWLQAEDFVLSSDTHVTGVRFWTIESSGIFDGSFAWSILSNTGGSPGVAIASGVSTATRTAQGSGCCGLNRVQNDIGVNANLLAGNNLLAKSSQWTAIVYLVLWSLLGDNEWKRDFHRIRTANAN